MSDFIIYIHIMVRGNRQSNKYRKELNEAINKSDIVKMLDSLFTIWVEENASEICFEPFIDYWRIVIKKEWLPDEIMQYPMSLHNSNISKIKSESGQMNPDLSNVPQEAKVSIITKTYKEANLLAKIIPTAGWEELIIYIIKSSNTNTQNSPL